MINNDNNQKHGEKIVKQLKRKFVKTVEENLLNHLFVQQSKEKHKKAKEDGNKLFEEVYASEVECYYNLYIKNVLDLTMMMEQLGFNEINFREN